MQFTQRQQKVNCNFQPSERTEVYPAAGVSSFAGSLPGIRVPVPPAADQVGRAGADHLTSFEQTNKVVPPLLPEGDAIVRWLEATSVKALVLPSPGQAVPGLLMM